MSLHGVELCITAWRTAAEHFPSLIDQSTDIEVDNLASVCQVDQYYMDWLAVNRPTEHDVELSGSSDQSEALKL